MNEQDMHYNAIVVGSGPAGVNAAVFAANQGAKTLIVEREVGVGGACVQYGTIPSKTLRETAVTLSTFRRRSGDVYNIEISQDQQLRSLMTRMQQVVESHQKTTRRYLDHADVQHMHGRAELVSKNEVHIHTNRGTTHNMTADRIFIATGSQPRNPPEIPIDHEHILDSDSFLSMKYLPQSLVVFGGGVIACEYASTFASLGVKVVMVDRYPSPLGFLNADLANGFVNHFLDCGGTFLGEEHLESVAFDGLSKVVTKLKSGKVIESDKALVALGRVANTSGLGLEEVGVTLTDRGFVQVDRNFRTDVDSIYAIGDVIGPPSLASASMHQGRAAASHAFDVPLSQAETFMPSGIYTIPEISTVGIDEEQATRKYGRCLVAKVDFEDIARGQIMAVSGGFLKLVTDPTGAQVLGVQVLGYGASELIHLGLLAIRSRTTVEELATTNFNFPTLAEAYRLAALDILSQTAKPIAPTSFDDSLTNQAAQLLQSNPG